MQAMALGDIIGIVDNTGRLVVRYGYDAWGKPTEVWSEDDPALESSLKTAYEKLAALNSFRYRGYVWDDETGLYYLRSRYYAPTLGRFMNVDALLGKRGGLLEHNSFVYAKNAPIDRTDETGMYSAEKALEYAEKWWDKRNSAYAYDNGGSDCANFVSQCMLAGGKKEDSTWYYRKISIFNWHIKLKVSYAWGNTRGMMEYLKKKYSYVTISTQDELEDAIDKGLILAGHPALLKSKNPEPGDDGYHAVLVGKITEVDNKSDVFYYAHTNDRSPDGENAVGFSTLLEDHVITVFTITD